MKKLLSTILMLAMCASLAACAGNDVPADAPELPEETERQALMVYLDGVAIDEDGYTYDEIKDSMTHKDVDGTYYYGATLDAITGTDLSTVKGVFFKAADGFVSYNADPTLAFVAAYAEDESGAYKAAEADDAVMYGGLFEGAMYSEGVDTVYMTTTACDWSVDIQVNGTSVGTLTMEDFMKKVHLGEEKLPTTMYDGSFKYAGGSSTYTGSFLGFGVDQMVAKLQGMKMEIPENYTDIEYYGTIGTGSEGKNEEYGKDFAAVEFFAMYDGMTHSDITGTDVGLTAFSNGTGLRWMTCDLTAINFITE